jgi:hypothetical protein
VQPTGLTRAPNPLVVSWRRFCRRRAERWRHSSHTSRCSSTRAALFGRRPADPGRRVSRSSSMWVAVADADIQYRPTRWRRQWAVRLLLQRHGDRWRFLRAIRLLRQLTDRQCRRCGQDVDPVAHPPKACHPGQHVASARGAPPGYRRFGTSGNWCGRIRVPCRSAARVWSVQDPS